ncbi:hypothetical protein TKK_0017284 [Trichogramma kaykai]
MPEMTNANDLRDNIRREVKRKIDNRQYTRSGKAIARDFSFTQFAQIDDDNLSAIQQITKGGGVTLGSQWKSQFDDSEGTDNEWKPENLPSPEHKSTNEFNPTELLFEWRESNKQDQFPKSTSKKLMEAKLNHYELILLQKSLAKLNLSKLKKSRYPQQLSKSWSCSAFETLTGEDTEKHAKMYCRKIVLCEFTNCVHEFRSVLAIVELALRCNNCETCGLTSPIREIFDAAQSL